MMPAENNKLMDGLRWIAVLPGALLAGFLITFPLHFILYIAFADGGFLFGLIPLPAGSNETLERALYPFAIAVTFILTGYKIAPRYKFRASAVLTGLYVLAFASALLLAPEQYHLEPRGVLAILGSFLALYLAWRQAKRDRSARLEKMADEQAQMTVDALNHRDTLAMWEREEREIAKMAKAELEKRKREADQKTPPAKRLITLVSTEGKDSKQIVDELNRNIQHYNKVAANVLKNLKPDKPE